VSNSPIVVIEGIRYKRAVADKLGLLEAEDATGKKVASENTAQPAPPANKSRTAGTARTKGKAAVSGAEAGSAPVGSEAAPAAVSAPVVAGGVVDPNGTPGGEGSTEATATPGTPDAGDNPAED
jgi:hypothetical protein